MTKTETIAKFPLGTIVRLPNRSVIGKVTGYRIYNTAFVGRQTFIEVTDQRTGKVIGEFAPHHLAIA
jgi:hypothetical protein